MRTKRLLRGLGILTSVILLACGAGPLLFGIAHTGVWVLLLYGAALLGVCLFWANSRPVPACIWRRLRGWVSAVLLLGAVAGACASALMVYAAWFCPPEPPATVVVLGCQVVDDQPSLMLRYRLEAALAYLNEHPQAPVVCAGGYKGGGAYSEAMVMERWLAARGVEPARIYREDASTDTSENLRYTAQIIRREGLPQRLAIATDSFHQLRGAVYARKNGLTPGALPAKTPWGLFPSYWVREWFGLAEALLLPNS